MYTKSMNTSLEASNFVRFEPDDHVHALPGFSRPFENIVFLFDGLFWTLLYEVAVREVRHLAVYLCLLLLTILTQIVCLHRIGGRDPIL